MARGSIVCVISLLMLSKCRRGYIIANVEILKVFFGVTLTRFSFFAPMLIQYAIYLFFVYSPFCEEVLSTSIWRVSLWRVYLFAYVPLCRIVCVIYYINLQCPFVCLPVPYFFDTTVGPQPNLAHIQIDTGLALT